MSDDNDHIEIELDDPVTPEKRPVEDIQIEKEVEKPVRKATDDRIDPEEGITDLKNKLQEEQRRRIEAENRAREAVQKQYRAQNETEEANFALVEGAIRTLGEESETIKTQYKEALAVGDYDKVAELQDALAENKQRLSELRRGHDFMKAQREAARQQPQTPPEPQYSDPVEDLASKLSPRSADWIRRNPEYARDQRLFQKMVAAHQFVTADGIQPDTDEYFTAIEDTLKMRQPPAKAAEGDDAGSEAAKPVQRRAAPPAAPVSRSGGPTPGGNRNVVRLTRAEIEHARDMGMTEQEYARNKQLLQQEGRM